MSSVLVGLCAKCRHARRIETARSAFILCQRSAADPRYAKYPRLPMLACAGYEDESVPRGGADQRAET